MFADVLYSESPHAIICFQTPPQKIPSQWSSLIYVNMRKIATLGVKIHMLLQDLLNVRTADHGQTCWQFLLNTCLRMCFIVGHHMLPFVLTWPYRKYLLNGRLWYMRTCENTHMWCFFKTKVAYTCGISGWHNARNQLTAAKSCVMPCMHDACACDTMCMTCWVPEYPCMCIMVQGAMAEMCGHVRAVIPDSFCYNGTHVLHVYIFSTMPLYHFLLQATTLCHACMLGACMHHHVLMQICAPGMVP
jgi:hypothetical protein